jgi:acetyltransferase-like isoleucine patch superfamily enzyme
MNKSLLLRALAIPRHISRKIEILAIKKFYGMNLILNKGIHISSPLGIQLHERGKLEIGSNTIIEKEGILNIQGSCKIGSNGYFSVRFLLGCSKSVIIGNNVAVGPNVVIVDTNKNYSNFSLPIAVQGEKSIGIKVGADCWIGANSVLLPGTVLGNHVVVGAGSVVRGVFPGNVMIAGSPAKILRVLDL